MRGNSETSMKRTSVLLLLLLFASSSHAKAPRVERRPLTKEPIEFSSPTSYKNRERYDPRTGEITYYDHKPRIVPLNSKAGEYAIKWIGLNGTELTVYYQRPDAIEAMVSADVVRDGDTYVYVYTIANHRNSGQKLSAFVVQTFASDAAPVRIAGGYAGPMTNRTPVFHEGAWIYFGASCFADRVQPGTSVTVRVRSTMPPGIVGCRVAGGRPGYKGVGEELPAELEDRLPGYAAWPKGGTLGPDESLARLPAADRRQYLVTHLSEMHELGWITDKAQAWYGVHLAASTRAALEDQTRSFLRSGAITTEVAALVAHLL